MLRNTIIKNVVYLFIFFILIVGCDKPQPSSIAFLKKTNIFEAQTGDYAHYRIPGIVITNRGTILAYCEARKNLQGDWGTIDILMRRREFDSKIWEPTRKIAEPPEDASSNEVSLQQGLAQPGEITLNNPVAIVDKYVNIIHFLYCVEYARCFYMFSDDDGQTFSEPVEITATLEKFRPEYDWKVLATGPGHGIQIASGRLIVPVWLSTGSGGHAHRPSCIASIYSDNFGKSWERGEIIAIDPEPLKNPSETVAVELADGRVMFNIRNESDTHRRAIAFSPDGAINWTAPVFDEALYEPICMGSIIYYSENPSGIIFANPDSRHKSTPDKPSRSRENLSIKMSLDQGKSWPKNKVLEKGVSGYSDLAVGPDGTIYCFYERGTSSGSHYNPKYLCIASFNIDWLME